MPEHLRENLLTHISLLATSHAKQQDEITKHKAQIAELTKLTADQQNQMVSLHVENKSLRRVEPEMEVPREITVPVETSEIVTLTNFQQHKDEDTVWFSPPLYTHSQGYKICFAVYPNGDGAGNNTHISVYTYLMPGEFDDTLTWPIRGEIRYQLLNQEDGENHKAGVSTYHERRSDKSCARVLYAQRSQGLGMGRFLQQSLLPKYLQKDCLKLRIYGGNVRM